MGAWRRQWVCTFMRRIIAEPENPNALDASREQLRFEQTPETVRTARWTQNKTREQVTVQATGRVS